MEDYKNDLLCFFSEEMAIPYEHVKSFNGKICDKADFADSHLLNVVDIEINPEI